MEQQLEEIARLTKKLKKENRLLREQNEALLQDKISFSYKYEKIEA
jgi:hypothetical protein